MDTALAEFIRGERTVKLYPTHTCSLDCYADCRWAKALPSEVEAFHKSGEKKWVNFMLENLPLFPDESTLPGIEADETPAPRRPTFHPIESGDNGAPDFATVVEEIGHCIAAWVCGGHLTDITVNPVEARRLIGNPDAIGGMAYDPQGMSLSERAVVSAAGFQAKRLLLGHAQHQHEPMNDIDFGHIGSAGVDPESAKRGALAILTPLSQMVWNLAEEFCDNPMTPGQVESYLAERISAPTRRALRDRLYLV
jgi:hypothetical protein